MVSCPQFRLIQGFSILLFFSILSVSKSNNTQTDPHTHSPPQPLKYALRKLIRNGNRKYVRYHRVNTIPCTNTKCSGALKIQPASQSGPRLCIGRKGEKTQRWQKKKKKSANEASQALVLPTTKLASLTAFFSYFTPCFCLFPPLQSLHDPRLPTSIYFTKFSEVMNTINDTFTNPF